MAMTVVRKIARLLLSARLLTIAWIALVLICGGFAAMRWSISRNRQSAIATLTSLLRSDRSEVQSAAANELRELGLDGIPPLVQALSDDRDEVFTLASHSIDGSLSQWQFLPPADASERLETLAEELANRIPHLPEQRRYVARRWAQRMILWPRDSEAREMTRLLGYCEDILRQSPVLTEFEAVQPDVRLAASPTRSSQGEANDLARERLQSPPIYSAPQAESPQVVDLPALEPQLALASPQPPSPASTNGMVEAVEPQRLIPTQAQPLEPRRLELTRGKVPNFKPEAIDRTAILREQGDLDVMRHLHDLDAALSQAAETELRRRGYRTADLPICQALIHPDPAVRRKLAEALPSMHNIDARPWLLQLTQDDHAEVRRAAEGILRTSRDPALEGRFR